MFLPLDTEYVSGARKPVAITISIAFSRNSCRGTNNKSGPDMQPVTNVQPVTPLAISDKFFLYDVCFPIEHPITNYFVLVFLHVILRILLAVLSYKSTYLRPTDFKSLYPFDAYGIPTHNIAIKPVAIK